MLSPTRTDVPKRFLDWLSGNDAEGRIFLSVVTIHEIEKGIALLERRGMTAKASSLQIWLNGLLSAYADKIIPMDMNVSSVSGRLEAKALAGGYDPGMADSILAGTAQCHTLAVVTNNVRDFQPFGIDILHPDDIAAT